MLRILRLSLPVIALVGTLSGCFGAHAEKRVALPLRVNPRFDTKRMPREMRLWHARARTGLADAKSRALAERAAKSRDTYRLGRQLDGYITPLLAATRATGDPRFLDEADRLMQIARATLSDTNGDGFLNWVWLYDPKDAEHLDKDVHVMDEIMTHSMVAYFAYAMQSNADLNPRYAERAAFWKDYLLRHYLAKWEKRGHPGGLLDKRLAHPFAAAMRMEYFLCKLTGEQSYMDAALAREKILREMTKPSPAAPSALTWPHCVPLDWSWGGQPVNYALYTIRYYQVMALEGFGCFAGDEFMSGCAATWRDVVLAKGVERMPDLISGHGRDRRGLGLRDAAGFASTWRDVILADGPRSPAGIIDGSYKASRGAEIEDGAGLARWDPTGKIAQAAEESDRGRSFIVPAYMLQALSRRGSRE